MIYHELYDGGFGRSALSKLSRTSLEAHAVVLPILYKDIKAMPGCCCPISGRYETRVPCSCSEEKRELGFPRLNVQALVDSHLSNPALARHVQTVDLHQQKMSATGQQMLNYGGTDPILLFLLLGAQRQIHQDSDLHELASGGKTTGETSNAPGRPAPSDRGTGGEIPPNIKNLHIGNGTRNMWDQIFNMVARIGVRQSGGSLP